MSVKDYAIEVSKQGGNCGATVNGGSRIGGSAGSVDIPISLSDSDAKGLVYVTFTVVSDPRENLWAYARTTAAGYVDHSAQGKEVWLKVEVPTRAHGERTYPWVLGDDSPDCEIKIKIKRN